MNCVLYFANPVILWFYAFNYFCHLTLLCDCNSWQCRFISIKRKENKGKPNNPAIILQAPRSLTTHLPELRIGLKQKADIWSFLKAEGWVLASVHLCIRVKHGQGKDLLTMTERKRKYKNNFWLSNWVRVYSQLQRKGAPFSQ